MKTVNEIGKTLFTAWALFILLWLMYMVLQTVGYPKIFNNLLNLGSFGLGALAAFIVIAVVMFMAARPKQ